MPNSLQPLFHALAHARNEQEMRLCFMDGVSDYFGVERWGIYLLNEQSGLASVDVRGVTDPFVELYEKVGRKIDPILDYVIERHAPVHEELVLPNGGWKQCELYQHCCAYYDHEHIMTGPIVGAGCLVGTVHFARVGDAPAFNNANIADLSALCLHLSATLAKLQTRVIKFNSPESYRLTNRELQIALVSSKGVNECRNRCENLDYRTFCQASTEKDVSLS